MLWKKVDRFVEREQLLTREDKVLLGLSGGADSVCLARYLVSVRDRLGTDLLAVHVNHGIRGGEADRDQEFVRDLCENLDLDLELVKADIPGLAARQGLSLEEAGRDFRYQCFSDLARTHGCNKIAVAHHGNDLAETMLFRMVRGTGPAGLAAMEARSGSRIRPLLCLNRKEIEDILERLGQAYVEDSSNNCTDYSRNYIRQRIVPELETINPGFLDHMRRLSFLEADQRNYLAQVLDSRLGQVLELDRSRAFISEEAYRGLLPYERGEALRRMLFHVCGKRRDIGHIHVEILDRLMGLAPGRRNDFPYGIRARRTGQGLLVTGPAGPGDPAPSGETWDRQLPPLKEGEDLLLSLGEGKPVLLLRLLDRMDGDIPKNNCIKYFDYAKIKSTLWLRTCRPGDYFILDQAGHRKKVRRYYIDEKISPEEREKILLLADGAHVLWIPGRRSSEGYRIDEGTAKVLRAEILGPGCGRPEDITSYL